MVAVLMCPASHHILDGACQDVSVVGQPRGEGRAIVEGEPARIRVMIVKSVFLYVYGTLVCLFEKGLVEVTGIFMGCFVVIVIVLHNFHTLNEKSHL